MNGGIVNQRPNAHAVFKTAARKHFGHPAFEFLNKRFDDALMHKDSVGTDAGLSGIEKFDQHGTLGSIYRVGILENNKRRMTAEFKGNMFNLIRCFFGQDLTHLGRSCEGNLSDHRVCGKNLTDRGGI